MAKEVHGRQRGPADPAGAGASGPGPGSDADAASGTGPDAASDTGPDAAPGTGPDAGDASPPPADDWTLLAKDLAVAFGVVAGIVLVVFAVTGSWPPVVVVESGSMMHADAGFGRVGTVDPGDLVFVVAADDAGDIVGHAEARGRGDGGPRTYGAFGDVIIFRAGDRTPIIHRAMAWVDVTEAAGGQRRYTVEAYGIHDARSVTIPELGLSDYRPERAGFLTKGDNNRAADQAQGTGGATQPVTVSEVVGVARGEVPWFGVIKLMVAGNACQTGWVRVAGACAPGDIWVMFGVGLVGLLSVPLAVDVAAARLQDREVVLQEIAPGADAGNAGTDAPDPGTGRGGGGPP